MSIAGKGQSSKFRPERDEHSLVVLAQGGIAEPSECLNRVSFLRRYARPPQETAVDCVLRWRTSVRLSDFSYRAAGRSREIGDVGETILQTLLQGNY